MKILTLSLIAFIASYAAADAQEEKTKKWKITGQLEEACSCNAACPCWFGSKPTKTACSGGEILFIEKGNYGKVKLDGLALANYAQSPENQTMGESFGHWNFSHDYLDEKATPEQRAALEAIAAVILPSKNASREFKTDYVSITRQVDGKEHHIQIGDFANFNGQLLDGGLGGVSRITNPPGADPIHHQYTQGTTSKMLYRGSEQNWDWTGSNYMFGTFTIDSEQYAKYAAETEQKKAAQKPKR